jgi:diguanylate cyclase (GGDEF)-like protein/PAS domain S-box-containing protein
MQAQNSKSLFSSFEGNRTVLYAGIAAAIFVVVITALLALLHLRQQAEMRTVLTTQNLARSVEQTIEGMIATIDMTLLTSADEIGLRINTRDADVRTNTQYLGRQLKRLPQMSYLRASNEHGDVIFGPGVLTLPNNISDREYFIRLRDDPNADFLVSQHLVGRIAGKWAWLFARRINKPDGTFGGVVFAAILADQIEAYFSHIQLDSGGSIVVRDADMGLIARYSPASSTDIKPGDRLISTPFVDALKTNPLEGSYVSGTTSIDGISRTHSYRRNPKYGFIINVGISGEAALADWHKQTGIVAGLVAAFIVASLAFVWAISHAWRRQEKDVTELAVSQRFIKAITDNLPGMVAYWSPDLHCRFANRPYLEWFGKQPETMIGITLHELLGERLFALNEPHIRKALAGEAQYFERTLSKADGSLVYTWVNYIPDIDAHGTVAGLFVMVTDVTPLKQAEIEKDEMRRNQLALLDAIQESTFLIERDGTILVINEIGARRLNAKPEVLAGKNIFDHLPPQVAESRRSKFDEIALIGKPEIFEDERPGHHYFNAVYPIHDAQDKVIRFAVYEADITQQHRQKAIDDKLSEINQKILQGVPLHEVLTEICQKVAETFQLEVVWLGRKEPDGAISILAAAGTATNYFEQLKTRGVRWDDTPQGQGPAGIAIRFGQTQAYHVDDPRFQSWSSIALENNLHAILAIPLMIRSELYGMFSLYSSNPVLFDSPELTNQLNSIGKRICIALETAMDQQQVRLLSSALEAAGNGVMITDPQGNIQWANPAFSRLCGYTKQELLRQTPRILNSGKQPPEYYRALWATISKGENWSSETVERAKDGNLYTVSQTITPIINDGELTNFISIHDDISAQKLSHERIAHMAHYDELTGLPNRALFYDRLRQGVSMAKRNESGLALLYMDLDGFKQVNDSLGHHAGDLLLIAVADRLSKSIRGSDTVARLGGDEFTIILNEAQKYEDVAGIAQKIIETISIPFALEGQRAHIGISIGIARYPEEANNEDELMKLADQAMYQAKSAGKNTYRLGIAEQR